MKRITDFIKKIQTTQFISDGDSVTFDKISVSLGDSWYLLDELNTAVNAGNIFKIKELEKEIENRLTESDKES